MDNVSLTSQDLAERTCVEGGVASGGSAWRGQSEADVQAGGARGCNDIEASLIRSPVRPSNGAGTNASPSPVR